MKLIAQLDLKDPYGGFEVLKLYNKEGAVVYSLEGVGGTPLARSNLGVKAYWPVFWEEDGQGTEEFCRVVGRVAGLISTHSTREVVTTHLHPDYEKED